MKLNNKGFSLVELLLAVVVSTIVFGAITALIAFSSRSMRDTNARIELQNQAKDALNHIESYTMEAEDAYWDDANKLLILFYNEKDGKEMIAGLKDGSKTLSDVKTLTSDSYAYWFKGDDSSDAVGGDYSVYFGKSSGAAASGTPAPAATVIPGATPTPAPVTGPVQQVVDVSALVSLNGNETLLKNYLLADNVKEFKCKVLENDESKKMLVDIDFKFDDEIAPEYSCGKRVYLRNQ